jgi:uncharacterized protein YccT (UPF0319 family)
MEDTESDVYFSNEALTKFINAQGRTIEKVICHLWHNTFDKNSTIEIIDNVELLFLDGKKLTIGCNAMGNGMDAIDFDYHQTKIEIEKEYGGKIKIFAVDASKTKMWEDVIGKQLKIVKLTKNNNLYKADSLVIDFGEEKREIQISPLDGLIIDYFEED